MEAAAAPARAVRVRGVTLGWALAAVAFLLLALAVGIVAGPVHIGVGDALRSVLARLGVPGVDSPLGATDQAILWDLRVPRVLLAALVGGMLAISGATYQGVFHNPLADPYLLGVAAGAGLGATLAIAYLPDALAGHELLPVSAFLGGAAAVVIAYGIGRAAGRERDSATLVLAGVTVASFFTAVQTFVQQRNTDTLQAVTSWILGSLPNTGWSDVRMLAPYVLVTSSVIIACRRVVDVLSLGDLEAESLGMHVRRARLTLVVAATVGTAAAVSVSGLIAFVGIIVPHAVRLVVGTSYRGLLPLSFVVGAGFLVLCDVIARTALSPAEVPIGVVTALFGAPAFALVLRTRGARA
ncbi:iron ABC transporter permease [Gaiella sp.]|jgi:iron complex transport system permease protein|uniref:FecCD family ABC transporter permease n=1 Tax=Gaiella sp. TaxID=2663207 RepID=UPI002E34A28F|nr:iron ABC transporter permease [Gaiella sp.]HEX5584336.1 iron ABC transporter permease [Gaiella sp.]